MDLVKMDGHQLKLWNRMIELIKEYKEDQIRFSRLVRELEGILDACDLRDKQLVEQWYDLWQPLEIRNAIKGDLVNKVDAIGEVEVLEQFLRAQL